MDILDRLGIEKDALGGRTAIITGSARGIGRAAAEALSAAGARVVISDVSDSGSETAESLRAAGREAVFIKTDVTDEESIHRLVEEAQRAFGSIDILVNNAVTVDVAPVMETPVEQWDTEYRTNLRGALLVAKAVLPGMLSRGSGIIVNMISAEGTALMAGYSASKAGLRSLTASLAREIPSNRGIAVFAFHPGMVQTPLFEELLPKFVHWTGMTPEQVRATMGSNPGYNGMMPVEHCAAALVKMILNAREFHGQAVDAFYPLVNAGIIDIRDRSSGVPEEQTGDGGSLIPNPGTLMAELIKENQNLEIRVEERTRALQERTRQLTGAMEELKNAELKLIESEKMGALGQLVSSIAHELNSPFAALVSNINTEELLLSMSDFRDESSIRKYRERMERILRDNKTAMDRITNVIKNLKDFTRLDEAEYNEVDINEALECTLSLLDSQIHGTVTRAFGDVPRVNACAAELNQVFMSILLCRLDTLKDEKLAMTVSTAAQADKLIISFEDSGIPMQPERLKDIFNPGFTVKNGRVGMDLGMAVSYRIVERHGGSIRAESSTEGSTRFVVELPK